METCYGCGAKAEMHPVLGVINKKDVAKGTAVMTNPDKDSEFVGVYVCAECHANPEHRTAHDLKCHFFMRGDKKALVGLMMAGSDNIGG